MLVAGYSSESSSDEGPRATWEDALFAELMAECQHAAPTARPSGSLRLQLERLRPELRRRLVSRTRAGCAPLFVAVRRGCLPLAEYLLAVCGARTEQRGRYGRHRVTPLWVAAVDGRLPLLRALADQGADLDAASDSGSTPARSACFAVRHETVAFLAENGADLGRPSHSGGSCLVNALRSPRLTALLLSFGASVSGRDARGRTALHHAARKGLPAAARLLLEAGADPHARSPDGLDPLLEAAAVGSRRIMMLLERRVAYPARHLADALALLSASSLEERPGASLLSWERAIVMYGPRGPAAEPLGPDGQREPRTGAELRGLGERDLRVAAVLVAARVLGASSAAVGVRARQLAELEADPAPCLWAMRSRLAAGASLLEADVAALLQTGWRLYAEWSEEETKPPWEDVFSLLELVLRHLPEAQAAAEQRPTSPAQASALDTVLRCVVLLLHVVPAAPVSPRLSLALRPALAARARSVRTGDRLLHLAASRLAALPGSGSALPSARAARALLRAGADPAARNLQGGSALLSAAAPHNYRASVLAELLAGGAHLDQPGAHGDTAAALLAARRPPPAAPRLLCLAARAAAARPPPAPAALPASLRPFLELHRARAEPL